MRRSSSSAQVQAGQPPRVIEHTFEKMEGLLSASGALLSMPAIPMTCLFTTHRTARHRECLPRRAG